MTPFWEAVKIHGWMTLPEMIWLRETAINMPFGTNVVEVGSYKGRSAAAISCPHINLTCVDVWEDNSHFKEFQRNMGTHGLNPKIIRKDTIEAAKEFQDGSVSWWFEDNGHINFAESLRAWYPKIAPDGLLSGHDFRDPRYPMIEETLKGWNVPFLVVPNTRIWYARKNW